MKDVRISIRVNEQEHESLKIAAIRKKTTIQNMVHKHIEKIINEDIANE